MRRRITQHPSAVMAASLMVTVGIMFVSMQGWKWAGSSRSDLAQWLMAGAAIATLLAALLAAAYAARAFGLEHRREMRWEETQRTAQASLVAAWPSQLHASNRRTAESPDRRWGVSGASGQVRNASAVPVTDVQIDFCILRNRPQDEPEEYPLGDLRLAVLPPGEIPQDVNWWTDPDEIVVMDFLSYRDETWLEGGDLAVHIRFTDAAGNRWYRSPRGELKEMWSRFS